jgi:hypothetical protein
MNNLANAVVGHLEKANFEATLAMASGPSLPLASQVDFSQLVLQHGE